MIIGLLGYNFENANKGCEALTYATLSLINKYCDKGTQIYYFSTDTLEGSVKKIYPNLKFKLIKIKFKDISFNLLQEMKKCDLFMDITYGDNFSDIYLPKFAFKTTLLKDIVVAMGKPLLLMPQTYGPFKRKYLKKMAKFAINRAKRVYSRDPLSIDYIKTFSNKNVQLTTDLAFLLPFEKNMKSGEKKRLGINVSGLLWKGGFHEKNQFGLTVDYKQYIQNIIEEYQDKYEIHLIPHVIETVPESMDGDLWIIDFLAKKYPKCKKAPAFVTAIEAKSYISNMDIFIGARMHSTIAALSTGVPVIPFSYSRKFEGLYNNLGYDYLIHGCSDTTDDAINKTNNWIRDYKNLKEDVTMAQHTLEKQLTAFEGDLQAIIQEYK